MSKTLPGVARNLGPGLSKRLDIKGKNCEKNPGNCAVAMVSHTWRRERHSKFFVLQVQPVTVSL